MNYLTVIYKLKYRDYLCATANLILIFNGPDDKRKVHIDFEANC